MDAVSVPTLPTTSPEIARKILTTAAEVTPATLTDLRTKLQHRYAQGTYGALAAHFQTLLVHATKT
jgi:hypothetical protein